MTSEEKSEILNELWDHSIVGLAIVEEAGKFINANPTLCEMLGYTETELKELRFQDVTLPSDRRADEKEAQLLARGVKSSYIMEKSYITKTRSIIRCLLKVVAIKEEDGSFRYFISQINRHEASLNLNHQAPITLKEIRVRYGKMFWSVFSVLGYGMLSVLSKVLIFLSEKGWL